MRRVNLLRAHGSPSAYLYKTKQCRCAPCRGARAEMTLRTNARRRPEIAERGRLFYAAHREQVLEQKRSYQAANREKIRERKRLYRAACAESGRGDTPANHRRRKLRSLYGLSIAQWDAMLASQGGCCRCCGTDDPGSKAGWHTDHNHDTGKVRGILCHHCNTGIGHFEDDPERLMAAIEYLAAATL